MVKDMLRAIADKTIYKEGDLSALYYMSFIGLKCTEYLILRLLSKNWDEKLDSIVKQAIKEILLTLQVFFMDAFTT